jgi:hypothetical protein
LSRPSCPSRLSRPFLIAVLITASFSIPSAQSFTVTPHADPPPADLADPIEALIAPSGARVEVGGKALVFWWVKSMPLLPASTDVAWSSVEEGTLVGAVSLASDFHDSRGAPLKRGIYTLRYGVLPAAGDRASAGVREFLFLSPADADSSSAALGHDGVLSVAKQSSARGQPAAWALDAPPRAGDRRAVPFAVPASRDGKDVGVLRFGLVLVSGAR